MCSQCDHSLKSSRTLNSTPRYDHGPFRCNLYFGRYLRECDFARIQLWINSGMVQVLRGNDCSITVSALTARYRKSLQLFQKVVLQTKVLGWDENAFYLEQRFLREDGFICAIVVTKNHVIQGKNNARSFSPGELVKMLGGWNVQSPALPQEVQYWIQYDQTSSLVMRNGF